MVHRREAALVSSFETFVKHCCRLGIAKVRTAGYERLGAHDNLSVSSRIWSTHPRTSRLIRVKDRGHRIVRPASRTCNSHMLKVHRKTNRPNYLLATPESRLFYSTFIRCGTPTTLLVRQVPLVDLPPGNTVLPSRLSNTESPSLILSIFDTQPFS